MELSRKDGWILRHALQLESLRRELSLPDTPQTAELLKRLRRARENLDAVVYALSSRSLSNDRRDVLREMLKRQRGELEACLAQLGISSEEPPPTDPLHYFKQLDAVARSHLAAILDVPEEPPYFEVLDIKAEEYLAQMHAFDSITEAAGFRERPRLTKNAKRGALVLTLSGSLIQISAPGPTGGRRYLYCNIYGNAHPPEGTLVLDRDITIGHRIRSVELTTSPVRFIRLAARRMSWKSQSKTFEQLAQTFFTMTTRDEGDEEAAAAAAPFGQCGFSPKAAERLLHQEYAESFLQFEKLRRAFNDKSDGKDEAELLTVCLFLQNAARELGFDSALLQEISEMVSVSGYRYIFDAVRQTVVQLPHRSTPEVVYPLVNIGRQRVTARAPLVLLSIQDGRIVDILGPMARIRR